MTALSFTHTASDLEAPNDQLTFSLEGDVPAGLTLDPATGLMNWTPTEAQGPSTNTFTVRVTDDGVPGLFASRSFTIVVNEVNRPPVLTVPGLQVVNELATLNISATGSDPDLPPNPLTFSLLSPPAGMTINPATGAITWTPTEAQGPGDYTITVVVSDANPPAINAKQLSVTNAFSVSVREVNTPPSLAAIPNRTINPGQTVSFAVSATDADLPANTLTFSLVTAPAGATINAGGLFTWRPPVACAGTSNYIQVRVADNGSPQGSDTKGFAILVNPLAPVALRPLGLAEGQFVLEVTSGTVGPDYVLQGSTDLVNWVNLRTNTPGALPFNLTDPAAGTVPQRFYRVRLEP